MKKYRSVSVIVPVYNEENTIAKIVGRVRKADTLGLSKEVIIVDDGSTDKTAKILDKIKDKSIKVYHQPYNKGKGAALRHGFEMATGDIILVQDADLEYNPRDYPKLLLPILSGKTKVVYGSRMLTHARMHHGGVIFYIGGQFINWLTNQLYDLKITDEATGYKVFDADLLSKIPLVCKKFDFCPEITAKIAKRKIPIYEVEISYRGRKVAEGKKINWRDGLHAIYTLLKYRFVE
jgi:dolichol-phosphate mannosyltransferase